MDNERYNETKKLSEILNDMGFGIKKNKYFRNEGILESEKFSGFCYIKTIHPIIPNKIYKHKTYLSASNDFKLILESSEDKNFGGHYESLGNILNRMEREN